MTNDYPIRFTDQLRQHLRALRKKRGLTQAQVGALIGVSQVRIAEIEANPGLVSFEQLMQLLSKLGVSLSLHENLDTGGGFDQFAKTGLSLPLNDQVSNAALNLGLSDQLLKHTAGLGAADQARKAALGLSLSDQTLKEVLARSKKGSW